MLSLCVLLFIIACGVWFSSLVPNPNAPAPLAYSAPVYAVQCADGLVRRACAVVAPGATIKWQAHLSVPERTVLTTNYSVWYETCDTVAAPARAETQGQIDIKATRNFTAKNSYAVPADAKPGHYRLTRFTGGMNTERAIYDVLFEVAGTVLPCS